MTWRSRCAYGGRVAILLLAVCLTADAAMPLMPGAFVWDTRESIDAVRAPGLHGVRAVSELPSHLSRQASTLPATPVAPTDGRSHGFAVRRQVMAIALPRFLPASETVGSSDAPDDH